MYPATFFGLFPAFPRDLRAFVAMSFDHRFDDRWTQVLQPGLSDVQLDGQSLLPHRVDLTMSGDSVLTGILDEISRCRIVVADITSLGSLDRRPVRNENVFYEVGIAHAVRQPEEVVLFRSDEDPLAFDISNVRVHHYDPDGDTVTARTRVSEVVAGSLRELQLRRQLSVRRAAESLDADTWLVLGEANSRGGVLPPDRRTVRDALNAGPRLDAISRLLEMTAIRAEFYDFTTNPSPDDSEPLVRYRATPFGVALFEQVTAAMGLDDPLIREHFRRLEAEGGPRHIGELP